jgi:hypothetical protein
MQPRRTRWALLTCTSCLNKVWLQDTTRDAKMAPGMANINKRYWEPTNRHFKGHEFWVSQGRSNFTMVQSTTINLSPCREEFTVHCCAFCVFQSRKVFCPLELLQRSQHAHQEQQCVEEEVIDEQSWSRWCVYIYTYRMCILCILCMLCIYIYWILYAVLQMGPEKVLVDPKTKICVGIPG